MLLKAFTSPLLSFLYSYPQLCNEKICLKTTFLVNSTSPTCLHLNILFYLFSHHIVPCNVHYGIILPNSIRDLYKTVNAFKFY